MKSMTGTGCVFPCISPRLTARYYVEQLGFLPEYHLEGKWPHIELTCGSAVLILTQSGWKEVVPNRQLDGDGYDACLYTDDLDALCSQYSGNGVQIIRGIEQDEDGNRMFVLEDIDGRWIAFMERRI